MNRPPFPCPWPWLCNPYFCAGGCGSDPVLQASDRPARFRVLDEYEYSYRLRPLLQLIDSALAPYPAAMQTECVIVAENSQGLVVEPVSSAREQLAYAGRMAERAAFYRELADKFQRLADGASRKVTLVP